MISYEQEVYRKLIHLTSLWMALAMLLLSKNQLLLLFGTLLLGSLVLEVIRRYTNWGRKRYRKLFQRLTREHEQRSFTGATYMLLSALLVSQLFAAPIASCAFAMMIVGDTFAALVGRRYGRHPIWDKSAEGSCAFFATSMLVAIPYWWMAGLPWLALTIGALTATLVELASLKLRLDDNLTIALAAGGMIQVFC